VRYTRRHQFEAIGDTSKRNTQNRLFTLVRKTVKNQLAILWQFCGNSSLKTVQRTSFKPVRKQCLSPYVAVSKFFIAKVLKKPGPCSTRRRSLVQVQYRPVVRRTGSAFLEGFVNEAAPAASFSPAPRYESTSLLRRSFLLRRITSQRRVAKPSCPATYEELEVCHCGQ